MQLLYVDVKNHQNLHSPTPANEVFEPSHKKENIFKQKKLLIDPEKIVLNYEPEKSIVERLTLLNNHNQKISFKIQHPKKNIFSVKCKKSSLNPKQSCQIFLFFVGDKQRAIIQDQFIITVDKERAQLHVPIICKPRLFRLSSTRRLSLHKTSQLKQNELQIQEKIKPKQLVLKKRKTGQIDFNSQIQNTINSFMDKFNSIHEFVKQKNVKKEIFIGQKALSDEKHKHIITFNEKMRKHIEQKIRKKVQSRLEAQYSQEGPIIRNFQGVILRWNKDKNLPRMVYQKGLSKVQQQVRKYLVNLRFEKIHRIFVLYRQFQNSNQHNNLPNHKKHEIYIQRLQKKINKKSEICLELTFDRNSIIPTNIQVQNEVYSSRKSHNFEINPRIGFDNWIPIEQSISYTHQLMDYSKKQPIPEWLCHTKLQENHLASVTNVTSNSKTVSLDWKSSPQNSSQLNFILDQLKIGKKDKDTNSSVVNNDANNKKKKGQIVSKGDIKINQAYNITSKVFSSMFSTKTISSLSRDDHNIQSKTLSKEAQQKENNRIQQNLVLVMRDPTHQKVFLPYLQTQVNGYILDDQFHDDREKIVMRQLGKTRLNIDYLKGLCFERQENQNNQQCRKSPLDTVIPYRNSILRKVPKQDKYEFDRLEYKAEHLLNLIANTQKQEQFLNYKLRGQIDLQIPNKNKIKTYSTQHLYEENFQNLNLYKNELLGKSNCLQTYLFQASKNKSNATFII